MGSLWISILHLCLCHSINPWIAVSPTQLSAGSCTKFAEQKGVAAFQDVPCSKQVFLVKTSVVLPCVHASRTQPGDCGHAGLRDCWVCLLMWVNLTQKLNWTITENPEVRHCSDMNTECVQLKHEFPCSCYRKNTEREWNFSMLMKFIENSTLEREQLAWYEVYSNSNFRPISVSLWSFPLLLQTKAQPCLTLGYVLSFIHQNSSCKWEINSS